MIATFDYRVAATTGVVCALVLLWLLPGIPAIAFGCGMTAIILLLIVQQRERKRYAVAGTLYLLAIGTLYVVGTAVVGPLPHADSIIPATMVFGLGSSLVIAIKLAGRRIARRTLGLLLGEETAAKTFDALASAVATLGLIWMLVTLTQKVTTHGSSSVGGASLFLLNVAGLELLVGIPLLGTLDIVLFLFVGCVLTAFYTVETLHGMWRATKDAGRKGAEAGGRLRTRTRNAVSGQRDATDGDG